MIFFSNKSRPYELGPYPLERIRRQPELLEREAEQPRITRPASPARSDDEFGKAVEKYHQIFHAMKTGDSAAAKAPVPDDLKRRSVDVKGAGYFLNASHIGITTMPMSAWLEDAEPAAGSHAIVVLAEYARNAENGTLAASWTEGSEFAMAEFRAYEVAIALASHIRIMGFNAEAHDSRFGSVDLERLAVMAGVAYRAGDELLNPFLGKRFALCAVTTDYELEVDAPLHPAAAAKAKGVAYWLGIGGATSGLERWRQENRKTWLSKFPMETVRQVDKPTTLIHDDEVPRVTKARVVL